MQKLVRDTGLEEPSWFWRAVLGQLDSLGYDGKAWWHNTIYISRIYKREQDSPYILQGILFLEVSAAVFEALKANLGDHREVIWFICGSWRGLAATYFKPITHLRVHQAEWCHCKLP